jgi:hypothetical protein
MYTLSQLTPIHKRSAITQRSSIGTPDEGEYSLTRTTDFDTVRVPINPISSNQECNQLMVVKREIFFASRYVAAKESVGNPLH